MGGVVAFIVTLVLNITQCITKPGVIENAFHCVGSRHWLAGTDNQVTISHGVGQFITFNPSALGWAARDRSLHHPSMDKCDRAPCKSE